MINKLVSFISVSMVAATITACGGGGNSGGTTPLPLVGGESGGESTQNPPVVPDPTPIPVAATGLDRLLGTMVITYQFTGSTTLFRTTANFSSNSYSVADDGSRLLVAGAADRAIGCAALPPNDAYEYLCIIARSTDGSGQLTSQNGYLFNLAADNTGSGVFEFCNGSELIGDACLDELLFRPDGPLSVVVTQSAKAGNGSTVEGIEVTDAELDIFQAAAEAEFGVTGSPISAKAVTNVGVAQTYQMLLDQM